MTDPLVTWRTLVHKGEVILAFSSQLYQLFLTPEQARTLAQSLVEQAQEAEGGLRATKAGGRA